MTRILCLHGMGCSSRIFKWQLTPFLNALGPHDYVFIDGELPCIAAPGIEDFAPAPYFCYYDSVSAREIAQAHEQILYVLEEEGPFDGVIGFSQGSALAASLLLHQNLSEPGERPLFNFGIFFSSILPFSPDHQLYHDLISALVEDSSEEESPGNMESKASSQSAILDSIPELRKVMSSPMTEVKNGQSLINAFHADPLTNNSCRPYHADWMEARISIPTLHIMGKADLYNFESMALFDMCSGRDKALIEHTGGHDVPRDERTIKEITKLALNTIDRGKLFASGVFG